MGLEQNCLKPTLKMSLPNSRDKELITIKHLIAMTHYQLPAILFMEVNRIYVLIIAFQDKD